ncbi:hypothetical protein OH77DRAFT_1406522 [Trametes cingulata]|nr:hypothetical protein OH77DRAFT_1406522 [Trametes cingulata]
MSHTFAAQPAGRHFDFGDPRGDQSDSPVILQMPYIERQQVSPTMSTSNGFVRRNSPPLEPPVAVRYSPYPSPLSATTSRYPHTASLHGLGSADVSPTTSRPTTGRALHPIGETIKLPPIRPPSGRTSVDSGSFHLPPISSMDNLREAQCGEPMAVLRRLQSSDEPRELSAPRSNQRPPADLLTQRRHSLADPAYRLSEPSSPAVRLSTRAQAVLLTPSSAAVASSQGCLPLVRNAQAQQPPRSEENQPVATLSAGARGLSGDDRLTQSMPASPFLEKSRREDDIRHEERSLHQTEERTIFSRQERPLSPPPSATSSGSSPSEPVRASWRPW